MPAAERIRINIIRTKPEIYFPQVITKWLLLLGLGAPAFHLALPILLGTLDDGYQPLRQYISELAGPKRPYRTIVNASFVIAGLSTIAFSIGLYFLFPNNIVYSVAPVLLIFDGMTNVGAGIFPIENRSLVGRIHTTISQVGALIRVTIPLFIWLILRREAGWRGLASFTLIFQVAIVITFAWFAYVTETRNRPASKTVVGLFQRIYLGVYYIWFVVLSIGLVRGFP